MDKKKVKQKVKNTYEKPISLSGASFKDVIKALLNTEKPEKNHRNDKDADHSFKII